MTSDGEDVTAAAASDRFYMRAGFAVMAVVLAALFGWGGLAELQGAVVVQGMVKVEGNRKSIQHAEGGTIRDILVREGDRVQRGQVLIRLDETQPRAVYASLRAQIDMLETQKARLLAERDKAAAITFTAELLARRAEPMVVRLLDTQTNVFQSRKLAISGQKGILTQRILELKEQIRASTGQIASMRAQKALIAEELDGTRQLLSLIHI